MDTTNEQDVFVDIHLHNPFLIRLFPPGISTVQQLALILKPIVRDLTHEQSNDVYVNKIKNHILNLFRLKKDTHCNIEITRCEKYPYYCSISIGRDSDVSSVIVREIALNLKDETFYNHPNY